MWVLDVFTLIKPINVYYKNMETNHGMFIVFTFFYRVLKLRVWLATYTYEQYVLFKLD